MAQRLNTKGRTPASEKKATVVRVTKEGFLEKSRPGVSLRNDLPESYLVEWVWHVSWSRLAGKLRMLTSCGCKHMLLVSMRKAEGARLERRTGAFEWLYPEGVGSHGRLLSRTAHTVF